MTEPAVFRQPSFPDYALLDSGAGEKLERFGAVILRRPDPQALWSPALPADEWGMADLRFVRESDRGGRWEARADSHAAARGAIANGPNGPSWNVRFGSARFMIRPTPFKHVGLFPEQAVNWTLLGSLSASFGEARPRCLNLFGYTGAASVLAALAGFDVTHVDASKTALAWTRDNMKASGLAEERVRVVLDDALAFARRETRRNARYHAILLDPPHHGRGPKGETWQFEEQIAELVASVRELAAERALVILSTYAIGCSPLALENLMRELGEGALEAGELVLPASDERVRRLPAGFCARWSRGISVPGEPTAIGAG